MAWPYNDPRGSRFLIPRHALETRAILVEPMRGAGGCVSALQYPIAVLLRSVAKRINRRISQIPDDYA